MRIRNTFDPTPEKAPITSKPSSAAASPAGFPQSWTLRRCGAPGGDRRGTSRPQTAPAGPPRGESGAGSQRHRRRRHRDEPPVSRDTLKIAARPRRPREASPKTRQGPRGPGAGPPSLRPLSATPASPTLTLPLGRRGAGEGGSGKQPRGPGRAGPGPAAAHLNAARPAMMQPRPGKHDRKHRRAHPAAAASQRAAHSGCSKAASHWARRSPGNARSRRRGADREALPALHTPRLLIGQDGAVKGVGFPSLKRRRRRRRPLPARGCGEAAARVGPVPVLGAKRFFHERKWLFRTSGGCHRCVCAEGGQGRRLRRRPAEGKEPLFGAPQAVTRVVFLDLEPRKCKRSPSDAGFPLTHAKKKKKIL